MPVKGKACPCTEVTWDTMADPVHVTLAMEGPQGSLYACRDGPKADVVSGDKVQVLPSIPESLKERLHNQHT